MKGRQKLKFKRAAVDAGLAFELLLLNVDFLPICSRFGTNFLFPVLSFLPRY